MLRNKRAITQAVLDQIDGPKDLEESILSWWMNIRSSGGMRLTKIGYECFKCANIESWSVEMTDIRSIMNKRLLLDLDRKLQYPYYIDYKDKKVVFYSSKEAMLAQLYGNIPDFVKNYG